MGSSHAFLACLEEAASLPAVLAQLIIGYRDDRDIYSTARAFAAKLPDGRVVTWGHAAYGGDSSSVQAQLQGVDTIYSTFRAFATKLSDGRVVTWGDADHGGDSSSVQAQLQGVDTIYSTGGAFAAKLSDGRVVTWGDAARGGDSSSVQDVEAASRQTGVS